MTWTARTRAGVRARLRRVPAVVLWCVGVGAALCLVAGVFIAYEQRQYADGHDFGEREAVIGTHVFDGGHPGGDVSSYADLAEQECAEHGADDEEDAGSSKWLEGCVDAVLRR